VSLIQHFVFMPICISLYLCYLLQLRSVNCFNKDLFIYQPQDSKSNNTRPPTKTRSSAVADKPRDAGAGRCCAVKSYPLVNNCDLLARFCDSQSFTKRQLLAANWPDFGLLPTPLSFHAFNDEDPLKLSDLYRDRHTEAMSSQQIFRTNALRRAAKILAVTKRN